MPVIACQQRELHRSRGHDRGEAVSRPDVDYSEMASERPKTLRQQKCPPIQPPQCSAEKIGKQSARQRPTYAVECSLQIAMAIRCKSLQGLQQHRGGHEGSPDHERPRPSEAEHQRETEIADDMVDLPTETRAILPFRRAKGAEYEQQDQDGHVANSCRRFKRHFRAPQNAWVNQR